jgi:hypothetical protein
MIEKKPNMISQNRTLLDFLILSHDTFKFNYRQIISFAFNQQLEPNYQHYDRANCVPGCRWHNIITFRSAQNICLNCTILKKMAH